MSVSGSEPVATTVAATRRSRPLGSTSIFTGAAQALPGATTCAFVRTYVRWPSRANAIPEALRTTFPAAVIWIRTALGNTLWTVSARGLPARAVDVSPRSGEATKKRPATTAAPPRLDRSRVLSTFRPTGVTPLEFPGSRSCAVGA